MTIDARKLHDALVVADTHNDLLLGVVARPPQRWGSFFRDRWLPQLRDGGVDIQVLPVFIDDAYRPEGALRQTLRMIEAAHRAADQNEDEVALCYSGADIDSALASGRIALVLALEGCPAIDTNVELLETLFRLGVRMASFAHFGRSGLADGSGEDATGGRLTKPGVEAVRAMERLGMLIDVSHLGAPSLEHVLELATRPVIATHSSARALCEHHRNLTDAQLTGIARGGGVVCVNFFAPFLHESDHVLARLVDHIEHIASVAGIEHVGIGPDFLAEVDGELTPPWCDDYIIEGVDTRACIPGLEGPRGLPLVTEALIDRGFTEDQVTLVLGGNVLRLLREQLGRPALERVRSTTIRKPNEAIDPVYWQRRLDELSPRHNVPGAALGILRTAGVDGGREDELVEIGTGVLSKATGVEVTPDSLFQIASIGKVWTTTLIMRLVDEGRLELDRPVIEYLPELRLADPEVTKQVTLRHLVTHTSGIDGDVFTDTGRDGDCVQKYVDLLDGAAQIHPMGATFSYCNSGFVLAGRVIEVVTGMIWDDAIRKLLFSPLGLSHTVTLPEEALLFRTAVGHVGDPVVPAPEWEVARFASPAGATLTASVGDLLRFVRVHLADGLTSDGTRLLSAASIAAMREMQVELPDRYTVGDSWGLGWMRFGWDGMRLIGHDGNSLGQSSFLRVLPERGLAVALLTNGGHAIDLYQSLYREIFVQLAGIETPLPLAPPSDPVESDVSRYVGTYERASARTEILADDGRLVLRRTDTAPDAGRTGDPVREHELVPVQEDLFVYRPPGLETWIPVRFYQIEDGTPYVHYGARANPKVS